MNTFTNLRIALSAMLIGVFDEKNSRQFCFLPTIFWLFFLMLQWPFFHNYVDRIDKRCYTICAGEFLFITIFYN